MQIKVKIKKCSKFDYWYANKVGEVFSLVRPDMQYDRYWVRTGDEFNTLNYVEAQDLDLIFEKE